MILRIVAVVKRQNLRKMYRKHHHWYLVAFHLHIRNIVRREIDGLYDMHISINIDDSAFKFNIILEL
jgi:hypothetical protein